MKKRRTRKQSRKAPGNEPRWTPEELAYHGRSIEEKLADLPPLSPFHPDREARPDPRAPSGSGREAPKPIFRDDPFDERYWVRRQGRRPHA